MRASSGGAASEVPAAGPPADPLGGATGSGGVPLAVPTPRLGMRPLQSAALAIGSPLAALAVTVLMGAVLFTAMGKSPGGALAMFFVEPLRGVRALSELAVKATPLALIALGLSVSFRANVWNIGAEGQFIAGAIAATAVAMRAGPDTPRAVVLPILLAGIAGGMVWGALTGWLRDRFNASEILVSLMLVYVAEMLLGYLTYGPWKDPDGFNFPQTITFAEATEIPTLAAGHRANVGLLIALGAAPLGWLFLSRTYAGFQLVVCGTAAPAARFAGFSARRALWTAFLVSGGLAGLAGALEVAGPLGQLTPHLPVGYGFAAIIVAFVGRLHPIGVLLSSLLMSLFYIGGELAQSRMGLPNALTGVFQGLLLFALLGSDAFAAKLRERGAMTISPISARRTSCSCQREPLMESFALMLASSVNAGTILALAALGLLINERAGVINLGAEGMMLMGALAAYATAALGHGTPVALLAGAAAAAATAAIFGFGVIWLGTNQYATGLALSLFGGGFTAFAGTGYTDQQIAALAPPGIPRLRDLPWVGPALFRYHPVVYFAAALAVALGWFFFRSRTGLMVRAAGESPESAHALGHPVRRIRFCAVVAGGALCGLAGAYVSVVYAHLWVEGLIAGKGWIALALTTFATWRPARVLLGAYLFGGVTMLQFHLQGRGVEVDSHLLGMAPYLATIAVLVLISRNQAWIRVNMPASLGKPFHPSH